MRFETKEAMSAYFWENQDLKSLEIEGCPDITTLPGLPGSLKKTVGPQLPRYHEFTGLAERSGLSGGRQLPGD